MQITQAKDKKKADWLTAALAVVLLLMPALYNHCYWVNPDSGIYIGNQFLLRFPADRSKFYSLFLILTNFKISLWLSVIAQCILCYYLVQTCISKVFHIKADRALQAGIFACLSLFSSCAWYLNQLTPDFFAGLLLLSLVNMAAGDLSRRQYQWHVIIACLSVACHHSHILIMLTVLGMYWLFLTKHFPGLRIAMKTLGYFSLGLLLVNAIINFVQLKRFTPSVATPVFVMSRLAESGLLKQFLEDNPRPEYQALYTVKDKIGGRQWDFMWNYEDFPHGPPEHWADKDVTKLYTSIIIGIISDSRYWPTLITILLKGWYLQTIDLSINDGLHPIDTASNVPGHIKEFYPLDYKAFINARQQHNNTHFPLINYLQTLSFLAINILTLFLLLSGKSGISRDKWILVGFIVLFLLINNIITSTLSTYTGRFNTRITWVLFLTELLILISVVRNRLLRNKFKLSAPTRL